MKRLLLVGALMGSAVAQSQFEVASVKRGRPDGGVRGGCHGIDSEYTPNEAASAPPLGRCVIRDGRLGHLIFVAFGLHSMGLISQPIAIKARKYSMPRLADLLTRFGPRQIIDATGLTGAYDFELSWDDTAGPSLFSALQEQLGLRLEPRKVPVSYFVIDSAQRPTEN